MENYIQLNRAFSIVAKNQGSEYQENWLSSLGSSENLYWDDILKKFRCVILAEAGAGKTEELKQQAIYLESKGLFAFFIRIEDIDSEFEESFEVGSEDKFNQWLDSTDEAWFFLDSVDESRLTSPGAFKKAVNKFANRISNAKPRAHVFVSSRPYSWRPSEDRKLMDDKLHLPMLVGNEQVQNDIEQNNNDSSLEVFTLRPLDSDRIKHYCLARDIDNVDQLLEEIDRLSLWSLAERPFDLDSITDKWKKDKDLGSRIDLLRHNIKVKLTDQHSADRSYTQTFTLERAFDGARRLAASVVLTGHAGIKIPGTTNAKGINAVEVLSDWLPSDVRTLLELGVFNDIVYDTVRFRHREVRELLAAEWFDSLLKSGADINSIKALFFRDQYGEQIITPKLRSILSWLILFDNDFYRQAISIAPEVAVEGGDPAILSLHIREQLLNEIVQKIVSNEDERGARDNSAIAKIAAPDLTAKAIQLINQNIDSDDAIFFLGRLAWQGKMIDTLPLFEGVVLNIQRDIYSRIAALRAIVTLGEQDYCTELWGRLNTLEEDIEPQLFSEFLNELPISIFNTQQLLISIAKLKLNKGKGDSYSARHSLTEFIENLSVANDFDVLNCLLDGVISLLDQEPFGDSNYCRISQKYAWLINYTTQILEKIIIARSEITLSSRVISILISIPRAKNWISSEYDDYKDNLQQLIPKWPELNDALYWASIKQVQSKSEIKGELVLDDWEAHCHGCFWLFDEYSYIRLLNYIGNTIDKAEQLIALSTVIRLYQQMGKPLNILIDLKEVVASNTALSEALQTRLGPRVRILSESEKKLNSMQKERDVKKLQDDIQRLEWIESLKANPKRINATPVLKSGLITNEIWWLYSEIEGDSLKQTRARGAQWEELVPVFGTDVAKEYKTAIKSLWRSFDVELQSEHEEYNNKVPGELSIAMAGLEIELREVTDFYKNLSSKDLKQALRFLAKELNGFPNWLETIYKHFPTQTLEAIKNELIWELEHAEPESQLHYVLHNLTYYAPWIHKDLATLILNWLISKPEKIYIYPEYCIKIMLGGNLAPEHLIKLIKREVSREQPIANKARWFALWVDCKADEAISIVEGWLNKMSYEEAKLSAEIFITELVGDRRGSRGKISFETYITPTFLKELYILAHKYVKSEDDITRENDGVYSPELRDDAQSARNRLFSLLCDLPGKEAYIAIKELALEHPEPSYRLWMTKKALNKAECDGDLETWTSEQVMQFEHLQLITPKTHTQLYELGINRLNNMKAWIENGNDSPWKTWQRADQENEIRNLIAGWLNQNCREQYITAQEPELANAQRMDIWLDSIHVKSPVPIELKMLDKSWSGNKLCERLRNQLVGDYIRESGASCGIMLLVSAKTDRKWEIDSKLVTLQQLRGALMNYWNSISKDFPKVDAVEVIVIDLNLRSKVSAT